MSREEAKLKVLAQLGADRPLWRREWILRDDLFRRAQTRDQVLTALQEIVEAGGTIYTRVTAKGFELLLVQAPKSPEGQEPDGVQHAGPEEGVHGVEGDEEVDSEGAAPLRQPSLEVAPPSRKGRQAQVDRTAATSGKRDRRVTHEIVRAFGEFGVLIEAVSDRIEMGPSVVRHRILPGRGVRLATLRKCAEDIARVLGHQSAPLFAALPEEPFVAMDLPRSDRQLVSLLPAIAQLPSTPGLWIAVGVTPSGEPVTLDLSHLLVAGATGSGKSIFLESMVLSLAHLDPSEVEIIIIDPKAVDFVAFQDLPHLRGGVITEPTDAVHALRKLLAEELPSRTTLLRQHRCVNMRELRSRGGEHPADIVLIIDEFADLIATLPAAERSEFEQDVLRLAQRARAVGIHLVLATQRPTTEFVSGAVKANIPTRICFRVPERVDSSVVLDRSGAECLLGKGDMLLLDEGRLQRVQGYWLTPEEISELIGQSGSPKGDEADAPR